MLRHRTDLTKDIQTLMLTADPNLEKVKAVFEAGKCYEWVEGKTLIGIAVVHERDTKAEIMNLSVASQFEGQGYARKILDTLTKIYADEGYHYLSIGTGNSSLRQLKIYQKNGFRIVAIQNDYFIRQGYAPIYEEGIQCRDMLVLEKELISSSNIS